MKLQLPTKEWNNWGLPPPIFYKSDPTLGKTPADKLDSLKFDIKNQPGERDSETVVHCAGIVYLFICGLDQDSLVLCYYPLNKGI